MKTFGEQLADARKAKGLTQDQLAAEMNITRQGVSRWENGRTLPDAETMKRLSQVLEYNFVSDEPIVLLHEEPAPADVSAQDEPVETAEAEEKTVEHTQMRITIDTDLQVIIVPDSYYDYVDKLNEIIEETGGEPLDHVKYIETLFQKAYKTKIIRPGDIPKTRGTKNRKNSKGKSEVAEGDKE